ncbi:nuclear transport factor 2 family protein [Streptomyces solicathayae]|uniref:Nuclear transport factor 2 family protein n=1 Tax=Streptomyces solicathayae TaxID=3081768 RepID=A0ABZ0LL31_9ACTN|nr:nuclear transport factor 2 family protein [Streptomyces sp. HUAS YS2]WOX19985.1 nuclear transport factor 2 family protein [Streptomyces sp. HUAS YS2]
MAMTLERLAQFGDAWRRKDLDALMDFMTEDCEFRASVGNEPGTTFRGHDQVRMGFALMMAFDEGYESRPGGTAFISGDQGAPQWSYVRTDEAGTVHEVHGCDLFRFEGDRIRVKDAYRKVDADITNSRSLPAPPSGA